MARIQSPSSINTYKQCPRKYYYSYILKLPRSSNIHCVRGNIVHEVLEEFFDIDLKEIDANNFIPKFSSHMRDLFNKKWEERKQEINELKMSMDEIQFFYEDSMLMIANWINAIIRRIGQELEKSSFEEAFKKIKPDIIEEEFASDFYKVRGFIDFVHLKDGKVKIMDYKTSKSPELKPEYRLQLGIYALLYDEKYGQLPDEVGIWFLKHGEVTLPVTEELIKDTKFEIEQIHLNTETKEITDYPRCPGPLCKYSTGQCEFYEECFGLKNPEN